jgi:predicted lipoprotein with Yx(FWY)xxD motif
MNGIGRQQARSWRSSLGNLAVAAVALAGLSSLALGASAAGAATDQSTASVISTAKNAKLGKILASGTTLYTVKPSKIGCDAECMAVWHPVVLPQGVMTATAGSGVDASKLGTKTAADGTLQVTYAGKPLYWFVKDTAPGQVHGNVSTKWGKWSAVKMASSSSGSKPSSPSTGGNAF